MAEKDVTYALNLLHTVQIKREAVEFASFVDTQFKELSKKEKELIWIKYLNQPKSS